MSLCNGNCQLSIQTSGARTTSLRECVKTATARGADLIVTYGAAAALAAKVESPEAPVLFADVYDPVRLELVSAKSLTGQNMTGIRGDTPIRPLFKYFVEAAQIRKLLVLYDVNNSEGPLQKSTLEDCTRKMGSILSLNQLPILMEISAHSIPFQEMWTGFSFQTLSITGPILPMSWRLSLSGICR